MTKVFTPSGIWDTGMASDWTNVIPPRSSLVIEHEDGTVEVHSRGEEVPLKELISSCGKKAVVAAKIRRLEKALALVKGQ